MCFIIVHVVETYSSIDAEKLDHNVNRTHYVLIALMGKLLMKQ